MEIHLSLLMIIILFVCSLVTLIENEILEDKDFTRIIMGDYYRLFYDSNVLNDCLFM